MVSSLTQPALEVIDLHKSFGSLEVLKGISLQAQEGDVISLIGSSGSGKSTFLRSVNMLEIPTSGTIRVGGEEIRLKPGRNGATAIADQRQIERIRASLGMVFQNFNLWPHMTVLENVMECPLHVLKKPRAECLDEAMAFLSKVGIADKRDQFPNQLSGGQQQRCAIARALAMHPKVMLFDEPTSALDPELVNEVLQVIRLLAEEGRTMLVVTHEMRFARDVSSVVAFLSDGQIEEQGPPEQLFGNPESQRCRDFLSHFRDEAKSKHG